MLIRKRSTLTGKLHTMDIPVTPGQLRAWNRPGSMKVQQAFPDLNADQREFLISGTTPKEWTSAFGGKE